MDGYEVVEHNLGRVVARDEYRPFHAGEDVSSRALVAVQRSDGQYQIGMVGMVGMSEEYTGLSVYKVYLEKDSGLSRTFYLNQMYYVHGLTLLADHEDMRGPRTR